MAIPDEILGIAVVVLAAVVVALVGLVTALALRLRTMRRSYASAVGDRQRDLFEVLGEHRDQLEALRGDLGVVHGNTEHLRDLIRGTVSRVGVVRYNAFDDMGGALSFSAALLDEHGDGLVVSAINGRTETRTYAKPVVDGRSEHHLSPEEEEAIRDALSGEGRGSGAPRGRKRRAAS